MNIGLLSNKTDKATFSRATEKRLKSLGVVTRQLLPLAVVATLVFSSPMKKAPAEAGALDFSFGNGGKVTTNFYFNGDGRANDIAIQADGKIVAVGRAVQGSFTLGTVARYNPDGSLDPTFDITPQHNGWVTTGSPVKAVAISPDGKIVAGGQDGDHLKLWIFDPDGTLHRSTVITTGGGVEGIVDLAVQSDGKVAVAIRSLYGPPESSRCGVMRLNADFSPDITFGVTGVAFIDFLGYGSVPTSIAVQPDGKILVGGFAYSTLAGDPVSALARFNVDGSLDTSFDHDGRFTLVPGNTTDRFNAITVQPGGGVVAVGGIRESGSSESRLLAVFFNADGSVRSFNTIDLFFNETAFSVATQADGKVIVAGGPPPLSNGDFVVARYHSDGTFDQSFSRVDFFQNSDSINAVAVWGGERVVAAGVAYSEDGPSGLSGDFAIVRYQGDEAPTAADLSITISDRLSFDRRFIDYAITVANNGPGVAHYVTLTDLLPEGTSFQSLTVPEGWVVYSKPAVGIKGRVSVSKSQMSGHASIPAIFRLRVRVNQGVSSTTITNSASVSSVYPADPREDNNQALSRTPLH